MCGRASLFVAPTRIEERFDVTVPDDYVPRYNIAPGEDLAVVRADDPGRVRHHEWGLVPSWADDDHDGFINARAETVEEKPSFREAAAGRRCLALADGFYEWQDRTTGSQPFRVEREDGAPFAMAGLYEPRRDGDGATVTVLTTEPNAVVEPLHHRMAVILSPADARGWLDADDPDRRAELLATPSADPLHAYPVSDAVNDPGNDSPAVAERADAPEEDPQSGLDDFG